MSTVSGETCRWMKEELSFFPFLGKEDLDAIACIFGHLEAKAGEVLFREGEPCDYLGYIVSGRLEIRKETEFERKEVALGIYSKGSMIGELCILDGHPRPISVRAVEDTSLVIITREHFHRLLDENPTVGIKFLKGLMLTTSIRLRKSFDRLASIF